MSYLTDPSEMLRNLVAGMISNSGGAVEPGSGLAFEFIAPELVRRSLKVGEFGRLIFGTDSAEEGERVTFESDWIERLEVLAGERGCSAQAVIDADLPPLSDPARALDHVLVLNNAVYRLVNTSRAWTRYLLLAFRYTALSDEKRIGLVQCLLNLETGSAPDDLIDQMRESVYLFGQLGSENVARFTSSLGTALSAERLATILRRALPGRIRRDLSQFTAGMKRRLDRDRIRIGEYYEGLRQEAIKRAKKKGGDSEREKARIEAISREYTAKVEDLRQKYALTIDIKLLQTIEVIMPVHRFDIVIRRRKAERRIALDWNPLAKKLEPPPCEYAYTAEAGRMVCDDASHIVSLSGLAPCAACCREFCRVCHPRSCPKCKRSAPQGITGDDVLYGPIKLRRENVNGLT